MIMRANIAVVADGGSLVEAAIAAFAALISPRACITSSDKAPPSCAGVVPLDCVTVIAKLAGRAGAAVQSPARHRPARRTKLGKPRPSVASPASHTAAK
jgi:hypothetical protein